MPTAIRAIQTRAFGRLFRSRLEARCAVFLEAMSLRWEYEPEGFELSSGLYLPDFKVYDCKEASGFYWLECKGGIPTKQEHQLALELSETTNSAVAFFNAGLMDEIRSFYFFLLQFTNSDWYKAHSKRPAAMDLKQSFYFDSLKKEVDVMGDYGWIQYCRSLENADHDFPIHWAADKAFTAVNKALSARFEHGEMYL